MTGKSARNGIVAALLIVIFLLGGTIVHVENERYALLVGMCPSICQRDNDHDSAACLKEVQTRASPFWHLYYAFQDTYF